MLIGSRAIAHWNKNFKVRQGSDWDIVGDSSSESFYRNLFKIPDSERIEWHSPKQLNNESIQLYFNTDGSDFVCNPYGLAIIYRSHLHRELNWDSHITKYHKFIIPLLGDVSVLLSDQLLLGRIRLTNVTYPQGNPNLNQSNEDFFDDSVEKVYDHDYLHELYAYEEKPMFEKLKKPEKTELAWCEKDLWNELSELQKQQCVSEEAYVIATERFLIPHGWEYNPRKAYYIAIRKVCTTLCSGWFRDFAIDNFPKVYDLYNNDKFNKVKEQLK